MPAVGDTIIYGASGVCKITGIQNMTVDKKTLPYYVLKPVFESASTIYVQTGSEICKSKMRRILSDVEIYALIRQMPDECTIWEPDENRRKERYRGILAGADRFALVKLIKTLYRRQEELKASGKGKRLHVSDAQFLKDAEKILYDEFAYVLDIKRQDVLSFIGEQIEATAKEREEGLCK
jgi:CarD family transcriptional regulator